MKYLIVLLLVLLVAWQWRSGRARLARNQAPDAARGTAGTPVDVVACAHCGVHLPARDAVAGSAGRYCDAQHRAAAER